MIGRITRHHGYSNVYFTKIYSRKKLIGGKVLRNVNTNDPITCGKECTLMTSCKSFNINRVNAECELLDNAVTLSGNEADLKDDHEWFHYEAEEVMFFSCFFFMVLVDN